MQGEGLRGAGEGRGEQQNLGHWAVIPRVCDDTIQEEGREPPSCRADLPYGPGVLGVGRTLSWEPATAAGGWKGCASATVSVQSPGRFRRTLLLASGSRWEVEE